MTIVLITHIILMSVSLIATTGLVIVALFGKTSPNIVRRINLVLTLIGIALGAGLLIHQPIGSRCVELTAYILAFGIAYHFIEARSHVTVVATEQV
jgi:hypothetical protein